MSKNQVHDFDNPDQGDEDEDRLNSIREHGDQVSLPKLGTCLSHQYGLGATGSGGEGVMQKGSLSAKFLPPTC